MCSLPAPRLARTRGGRHGRRGVGAPAMQTGAGGLEKLPLDDFLSRRPDDLAQHEGRRMGAQDRGGGGQVVS